MIKTIWKAHKLKAIAGASVLALLLIAGAYALVLTKGKRIERDKLKQEALAEYAQQITEAAATLVDAVTEATRIIDERTKKRNEDVTDLKLRMDNIVSETTMPQASNGERDTFTGQQHVGRVRDLFDASNEYVGKGFAKGSVPFEFRGGGGHDKDAGPSGRGGSV